MRPQVWWICSVGARGWGEGVSSGVGGVLSPARGLCWLSAQARLPFSCLSRDLPLCFLGAAGGYSPPCARVFFTDLYENVGQVVTKIWPGHITLGFTQPALCYICTAFPLNIFFSFLQVSCLHSQPDVIFHTLLPGARKCKLPLLPRVSETLQSFAMETTIVFNFPQSPGALLAGEFLGKLHPHGSLHCGQGREEAGSMGGGQTASDTAVCQG